MAGEIFPQPVNVNYPKDLTIQPEASTITY